MHSPGSLTCPPECQKPCESCSSITSGPYGVDWRSPRRVLQRGGDGEALGPPTEPEGLAHCEAVRVKNTCKGRPAREGVTRGCECDWSATSLIFKESRVPWSPSRRPLLGGLVIWGLGPHEGATSGGAWVLVPPRGAQLSH